MISGVTPCITHRGMCAQALGADGSESLASSPAGAVNRTDTIRSDSVYYAVKRRCSERVVWRARLWRNTRWCPNPLGICSLQAALRPQQSVQPRLNQTRGCRSLRAGRARQSRRNFHGRWCLLSSSFLRPGSDLRWPGSPRDGKGIPGTVAPNPRCRGRGASIISSF